MSRGGTEAVVQCEQIFQSLCRRMGGLTHPPLVPTAAVVGSATSGDFRPLPLSELDVARSSLSRQMQLRHMVIVFD